MKKNVLLVISILLLIISCGICGCLYYRNIELTNNIQDYEKNIEKVQNTINNNEDTIKEKESEYEKLKETVKEQLEELSIWEETKENLNKSLS